MGHGIKECTEVSNVIKHLLEDDLPYSVALKVESKLVGKVSQKLGVNLNKSMRQFAYVRDDDNSTQSKCQSIRIETSLMATMDDITSNEGTKFRDKVLDFEITTGRKGVVGDVLELESATKNTKERSVLELKLACWTQIGCLRSVLNKHESDVELKGGAYEIQKDDRGKY
ncbi:hypothetical protein Gogos_011832 [Gossypium gossypioides]|uniref:Uncharacterized protein n=1 Tax=Gossypium gossypioides TaxID=34282 RepID=A0A7J9BQL8_GOSGO|nr:hypothetical protein [Gossypium gossypioides]